jgi:ABC-2 type transport system permease protein
MNGDLTGTGRMVRLALRRDRVLLPSWVMFFAATAALSASATAELYPTEQSRIEAADAVNSTAATVALYGRIYDPTSLGALSMLKMTVLYAALISVFMVMMLVRHTRADEEAGRLELVGSGAVGRAAPLTAAFVVVGAATLLLGLLTGLGLVAVGLPSEGSFLFGAGWAATALCFTAVAAVAAQVTTTGRAANGLTFLVIGLAYVLRAVGDLAEQGPGWLSWLSPIGWNQQIRAYAGDRWSVLALPLLATAVLVPVAYALRRRRDLGAGALPDRPGRPEGLMGSPFALAWRLQRGVLLAWTAGAALLSVVMGSVAHNVTGLLNSPGMAEIIRQLGGEQALTDAFIAAELGLVSAIAAAYGISAASMLGAEEAAGHAEGVLATATPRTRWVASHAAIALLGVAWLLLVTGVGTAVGHGAAIGDFARTGVIIAAALAHVPAAWVLVGLVLATWGLWPRAVGAVWGVWLLFLVVGEFGTLWDLPAWAMDISPFAHSPLLPGPDADLSGLLWLPLVAAALVVGGTVAFRRRDVESI